ncbi:DinB family protein [Cohnella fermenti]|uniref:DUF664 domain-containing protein n=1 Tax=Cohnella fermenti TaxID=2565925 RepID=A0A4S4C1W0_9BACL|nr:DinB family protein [Cohnella fermenti]THF81653.1 DUF664 domain-containing protein [Cohnella fermenti]
METLRRMVRHLFWADRELAAGVEASGGDNREALRLLRHVAIAEKVWLTRLNGGSSVSLQLWRDDAELGEIKALFADNERGYDEYLDTLSEDRLDDMISYTNQSGTGFRTSIRDILTHVALHGQYHRGQINRAIRQSGGEPRGLDFILFSRLSE